MFYFHLVLYLFLLSLFTYATLWVLAFAMSMTNYIQYDDHNRNQKFQYEFHRGKMNYYV